jgi:hypothetical protein
MFNYVISVKLKFYTPWFRVPCCFGLSGKGGGEESEKWKKGVFGG